MPPRAPDARVAGAWDAGLEPGARERMTRLNPSRYLQHHADSIADYRARAATLPRRWDVVEIGSNRGTFCIGLARSQPRATILALEWREKWVGLVETAAREEDLEHLHSVGGDARIALPLLAPASSVSALFVLYPDPWWKGRHEHRRLLDTAFFEVVAELLAPGGLLALKTDVRRVYDAVLADSASVSALAPLPSPDWPDERGWAHTAREQTCLRSGIATYRLYWRRQPVG